MPRHWKEPYSSEKALAAGIHDYEWAAVVGGPDAKWIYYVTVSRFTFAFFSLDMLREYLEFYSTKILPSSRMAAPGWANCDYNQRRFERLPLRLRTEPQRQRVIKALQNALEEFGADA